ncbi:hypothetical protein HYH02_009216 [Chlamydomonas schloesseri]|uniref:Uncharacterized protein n=1 Tax=Chlamydomonas schloesseri TaxID=2026947 RepID=A0A835WAX0_9CHLO|nr:hypothetical protein HYH02_009216 [Chlamydomonas schloesseri]|eukprot:KAG2444017.1 hypothetical protein HYH02_009216 [Chlamydomonas schloesseri]
MNRHRRQVNSPVCYKWVLAVLEPRSPCTPTVVFLDPCRAEAVSDESWVAAREGIADVFRQVLAVLAADADTEQACGAWQHELPVLHQQTMPGDALCGHLVVALFRRVLTRGLTAAVASTEPVDLGVVRQLVDSLVAL